MRCGGTGRLFATAAWMRTRQLRIAGWDRGWNSCSSLRDSLGFRMPAEWEPHEATWIAWPHEKTDWPGKFAPIQWIYGEIVRHLSRVEKVHILVENEDAEVRVGRILKRCGADLHAVRFFPIPTDRSWTRDFCPIFVRNADGRRGLVELAI